MDRRISIDDIRAIVPFSQGSTEIFLTGLWSSRKPAYLEKTSPCRCACPIGTDMARAFGQASRGDFDEALRIVRRDNPLPGVCGRVCYHPCELECNRRDFDEPVNIRGFERFLADNAKVNMESELPAQAENERVGVIGSGPAGLSAAWVLARLGYPVTIFEALPEPGGMLRYGIPEYRLPRNIVQREIQLIRQSGVEIRTGLRAGKDFSLAEIRKDYQAVFLAVGAHRALRLGIEGEGLPGVVEGLQLLRGLHLGQKIDIGQKVAVIGGGNTAVDCARTAKRLGGKEVSIIYRRSRAEMPAIAEDITQAEKDGITIHAFAAPRRITFRDGRIGLECIRTEPGEPDSSGRARPVPVEGSEYIVALDTVITAAGQAPEIEFAREVGISLGNTGVFQIQSTMATNIEGIFAGGDGAGQRAFVADAIAGGKMGAFAIWCYLKGKDIQRERDRCRIGERGSVSFQCIIDPENYPVDTKEVVTFDHINTLCFQHGMRHDNPAIVEFEDGAPGFGETVGGLSLAEMSAEVDRCFKCGACSQCNLCYLLCPDIAVRKIDSGYAVNTDYCKGCGQCASTCPGHVIEMVEKL